jgi:hypothetical protein
LKSRFVGGFVRASKGKEVTVELCIYCRNSPRETSDHVPPKGLFKEPRPSNLITVPACFRCNNSFSADDEYFLNIALDWGASETCDGKKVVDKRLRSMKRKESRRVWEPFFAKLKPVEVYSPSGLYLANSFGFSLDTARLIRTVNRIIRGLYFEVTKTPLPVGDCTRSMLYSQYVEKCKHQSGTLDVIEAIQQLPRNAIGDGTFEFGYFHLDKDDFSSFWYLEFYQRFGFVGITRNEENADDNEKGR